MNGLAVSYMPNEGRKPEKPYDSLTAYESAVHGSSNIHTGSAARALGVLMLVGAVPSRRRRRETFGVAGPAAYKAAKAVAAQRRPRRLGIDLGDGAGGAPAGRRPRRAAARGRRRLPTARRRAKGLRYGVGRDLQLSARDGEWYDLADGSRLWVGEIVAADALGVRLHFRNVHLPAGAELAVYRAAGRRRSGTVAERLRALRPRAATSSSVRAARRRRSFWTGTFAGERVRIEYLVPAGRLASCRSRSTRLQHLYRDPVAELAEGLTARRRAPATTT